MKETFKIYNKDKYWFDCPLKSRVTPALKAEIAKIADELKSKDDNLLNITEQMLPKIREIQAKEGYEGLSENDAWNKAIKDGLISNDELIKMTKSIAKTGLNSDELIKNDIATIKMFKCLLDLSGIDQTQNEAFDSDFDGEFWQEQDIEGMEKAVQSFCGKNGIRTDIYQ